MTDENNIKVSDVVKSFLVSTHGPHKYWVPKQEIEGNYVITYAYNPVTGQKRIIDKHHKPYWFERWIGIDDSIRNYSALRAAQSFCRCEYMLGGDDVII